MRARRLIEQQDFFNPERLVSVAEAFEKAWTIIGDRYSSNADREAARMRLATIMIDLAQQRVAADDLTRLAVEIAKRPLN